MSFNLYINSSGYTNKKKLAFNLNVSIFSESNIFQNMQIYIIYFDVQGYCPNIIILSKNSDLPFKTKFMEM